MKVKLAEKAAWEFVKNVPESERIELVAICPGVVRGPTLTGNIDGQSMQFISRMLTGHYKWQ